jgi:hypothetical protein
MSKQEIETILQIAQKLVNHLPKEMDDQLKVLIARGKQGQDTTIEIIDLLSPYENIRRWMKEQINEQGGQVDGTRGFDNLAGSQGSVPRSKKWVCPKRGCTESLPVIQAGEDAPVCSVHRVAMTLGKKEG